MGDIKIKIMTQSLEFESRIGRLSCRTDEVDNFTIDFRNFEQFFPEGDIKILQITNDSCNIHVPLLGSVSVRITEKIPYSRVGFSGETLQNNKFTLTLILTESEQKLAAVRVLLKADLNSVLNMMVAKSVEQFLEKLIFEMERFKNWQDTVK